MRLLSFKATLAGGMKTATRTLAGAALIGSIWGLLQSTNQCWASDIGLSVTNGLSVTSWASHLSPPIELAQGGVGAPAGVGAATGGGPAPSPTSGGTTAEEGWLSGLHISGFLNETLGMWQNPTALRDFTPSRNNLAVARTLLQVDENYRLNENNTFFMREWFVYEPPYSFNSANNPAYAAGSAAAGNAASFGHFMNDFYNQYTVRDAWWENKTGPLTTFIGNQIVVWGQSIAFGRAGTDVYVGNMCLSDPETQGR